MTSHEPRSRIWAVLPAKGFGKGKSRLSGVLSPATREELARQMFKRVIGVVSACPRIEGVLVATDADEVAELALGAGAKVIRDSHEARANLGQVVDASLSQLRLGDVTTAAVLMCDLPLLGGGDVEALLELAESHELVVAPDSRREGTNALAIRLDTGLGSRFGRPDSFAAHLAMGREAGLTTAVLDNAAFGFDVDTSRDLADLQAPNAASFLARLQR